jgi:protocatechuate 3,4-dioxygenase beta subunit
VSSLPASHPPLRSRGRAAIAIVGVLVALIVVLLLLRSRDDASKPTPPAPTPPPAEIVTSIPSEHPPHERVESKPEPVPVPTEPEPPAAIRVTGRVLDGDTDSPLSGAKIEFADIVWAPGTHEPRLKSETVSAADGTFTTVPAPSSQYRLRVSHEGYATEQLRVDVPELPRSLVGEGQQVSAGDVRLRHGLRARFRVVDATTQAPIAGASLYIFEGSHVGSSEFIRFLGITDEHGLREVAEPIVIRSEDTTVLALTDDAMATLPLASGDRLASEREFVVPIGACGDFLARVCDEDGAPLECATVTVCPRTYPMGPLVYVETMLDLSGSGSEDGRLKAHFRAKTDAKGSARLHGFPRIEEPAGYELSPSLKGYDGKRSPPLQPGADTQVPTELVLTRRSQPTRIEGTVRSEDGSRLPPVTVRCGARTTTADPATAHYELTGFDFSTFTSGWLQATASGWASDLTAPLPDSAGKCVQDLTLFRAGSLRGVVLDDAGKPVGGVRVWIQHNKDEDRRKPIRTLMNRPVTLTDGRFEFSGLRSGEYVLNASLEALDSITFAGPLPELRFPPVVASAGDLEVRIVGWRDCSTKGSMHSTVVSARTRAPVDIAAALLMPPSHAFGIVRPRPGSFRIRIGEVDIPSVPVGRWGLWVLASSGAIGFAEFETTEAAPSISIEVRVPDGALLTGRLSVAEGTPPPSNWDGYRLFANPTGDWVTPNGGRWPHRVQRDGRTQARADGSFAFENLTPGRYMLQASDRGLQGMLEVAFLDGDAAPVGFVLRSSGRATITVDAPIELFDGLTMLRYIEGGTVIDDFPLKADVPGQNRRTLPAEPGSFRIQAWRRANAADKSEPKSFLFDESFELKADETRNLTIPAPR